ncbi:MAG TPA: SAM-dependent chlorinase/fluorinase [Acidimicrobiia bacterium]|nr:SAM-dependent chlorinase/fluorinase [Acidimicrobiia bacterium]
MTPVPERHRFVSFLSDYGRTDEFVGVCHAVMVDLAPHLRVVDITHDIAPFDVRAGALALVRAVQYLPEGIVLAVVDPGVATDRMCVAVEVAGGVLVGPDNGLLTPAVAMLGGPLQVVGLTNPAYQLAAPGPTFAGRDVMAPAAAHLANGVAIGELGDRVDPAALQPGILPVPEAHDGAWRCDVLWVDRFGNCQLNLDPDELRAGGCGEGTTFEIRVGDAIRRARWVRAYADARPSELAFLVDSYGLASLALDRRSAADELGIRSGAVVTVVPPGATAFTGAAGDGAQPVRFGRAEPSA